MCTGNVITVTKQRALENTAKKIEVTPEGNACSILIIKPAFKTYAEVIHIHSYICTHVYTYRHP